MKNGYAMRLSRAAAFATAFVILLVGLVSPAASAEVRSIGVMDWKVNAPGDLGYLKDALPEMLASRIAASGGEGIRVEGADRLQGAAPGEGADAAGKAAGALGLDYVLYGSITILGESVSLDARLLDADAGRTIPFYGKGRGMDSVMTLAEKLSADVVSAMGAPVGAAAGAPAGAPEAGAPLAAPAIVPVPPAVVRTEPEGFIIKTEDDTAALGYLQTNKLEGVYHRMEAADLDGDGTLEYYLLKKTGVSVAALRGKRLEVTSELLLPRGVQYVMLSILDTDGDGQEEIYVSGIEDARPASVMMELARTGYRVVEDGIGWATGAVEIDGQLVLAGQKYTEKDGLTGRIVRLRRDGERLVEAGELSPAPPVRVERLYNFSVTRGLVSDGRETLVAIDRGGHIGVYGKEGGGWSREFRSPEVYGGTLNYMEPRIDTVLATGEPVPVEGRVVFKDLDGDGAKEIIKALNAPGGLGKLAKTPRSFKTGVIVALEWDGTSLKESWRTREVPGYIADFMIEDTDGDGTPELTMLVVEATGLFSSEAKSYILSYELSL